MFDEKKTNFEAYFLGPKGENKDFYEKLLIDSLDDHVEWRQAFHLDDSADYITDEDKKNPDFINSQKHIHDVLYKLRELLKKNQPFFSPRYIGHMNWEVMAAPIIAFFNATLYNPNNVAKAGSTGTSELELEVGKDFLRLFGMDQEKGWGHICTGGTIANMEALWIARNMKVVPLVMKEMLEYFNIDDGEISLDNHLYHLCSMSDLQLLSSFSPEEIILLKQNVEQRILENVSNKKEIDVLYDEFNLQHRGLSWKDKYIDTGLVYLPQTKHYSLKKAMDLLGLGHKNIRYVPVNDKYQMDMDILEEMLLNDCKIRPILAVVGVAGSTEESSVDQIDKILEIRDRLKKDKNISFHVHVDAAYGGYVRSLFLDEKFNFMNPETLSEKLKELGIIGDKENRNYASWPHESVFSAYKAMSEADTITIDPHKLGYVLYPAGGIALKNKEMREYIHSFAPYVFPKPQSGETDILIGSYILEGSKPGAAAAAVWTAHRIMPLNIYGYGKLIGETIDGAQALWHGLQYAQSIRLNENVEIEINPIVKPDINIVNYTFNFVGNSNLKIMNELTEFICANILGPIPEKNKTILSKRYIVSDTDFSYEEYGDSPLPFLLKIGIPTEEWENVHSVKVGRSTIMSPYLTPDYVDENYVDRFIEYLNIEIKNHKNQIIKILSK